MAVTITKVVASHIDPDDLDDGGCCSAIIGDFTDDKLVRLVQDGDSLLLTPAQARELLTDLEDMLMEADL